MIPRAARRAALSGVVFANATAQRLAIRLTRWTGKSREYVYPTHLLGARGETDWYLGELSAGDRLLDVGCGNAMHTLKAARLCALAAGIDRSAASLGVGARSCRALGVRNVHLVQGDAEERFPFRSASFDKVLCGILRLHPTVYDTPLIGVIDVLGGLSLAVYARLTRARRRLAECYPDENAGFYAVCAPR